jgi:uncharacterized membrane protein
MKFLQKNNSLWFSWLITLTFFVIYGLISFWNHHVFRSFAYDLGIKNQTIWDYAHLRMNYNSVLAETNGEINVLANHFEPVLMLFSPLYYIFGSYTLLVVQIAFILIGGWGVRKIIIHANGNEWLAALAQTSFYSFWGFIGTLSFDFHTNVIAAAAVPWLVAFAFENKFWKAFGVLLFIVLCKENMALWAVFISLGIAFHLRKEKKQSVRFLMLAAFSTLCFVMIMAVIMPYFSDGKLGYLHFKYAALGPDMPSAIKTLLFNPGKWFPLLWEGIPNSSDPFLRDSKIWLYEYLFLCGGILLLFRPGFLIMLVPVLAQKLFSDDPIRWGIFSHYSVEFAPILIVGAFLVIADLKLWKTQILAGFLLLISIADVSKDLMDRWQPHPYKNTSVNVYLKKHYLREISYDVYHSVLDYYIPPNASVSAVSYMVPHLAFRKKIYQFPTIKDAEYIVICDDRRNYYPFGADGRDAFKSVKEKLENDSIYQPVFKDKRLLILQRRF